MLGDNHGVLVPPCVQPSRAVYLAPRASAPPADGADPRIQALRALCQRLEIRDDYAAKLRQLEAFDIVLLIDDSGSMSSQLLQSPLPRSRTGANPTRWDEAKQFCGVAAELAACLDVDGIDVRFLNRPGFAHVRTVQQPSVVAAFDSPPSGYTPLAAGIASIVREKAVKAAEKKLLIVVLTDGEPTDADGTVDIDGFKSVLHRRPKHVYTTIVACTDDSSSVAYLNGLDKSLPRVDVVDDYHTELKQVLEAQGPSARFSFADYVCKALLGAVDAFFDALDGTDSVQHLHTQEVRPAQRFDALAPSYIDAATTAAPAPISNDCCSIF